MTSVLSATWRKVCHYPIEISLFFCLWFFYGVCMNARNLVAFNLQQAGIEAIVERHQFALDGSPTPKLQMRAYFNGNKPFGDVFLFGGKMYPAKQPGQFLAGAFVY